MKTICFVGFHVVLILLAFRATGAVVGVRVPNGGSVGNTFAQEPFSLESLGITSSRQQQVYSASEFSSAMPNGGFITQILFRYDDIVGSTATTFLPEVQIDFAVTHRGPDQLSTTFDENIGNSLAVAYPRGGLTLSGAPGSLSTRITFATPYFYNPTNGNLLLQIQNFQRTPFSNGPIFFPASPLDAQNAAGDTVSRVFAYDANAATGTADSLGLVTELVFTPVVPEPSTIALTLIGICLLCFCRLRKKRGT